MCVCVCACVCVSPLTHPLCRALELASKHKTHIDTVLLRRSHYLDACGRSETLGVFARLRNEVDVDSESVAHKVREEAEAERARPGAKPYA